MALSPQHHLNGQFNQSASLLHANYGQSLDKGLMATDPFYALSELYSFSAHSICQFLNMIDSKIMEDTGYHSLRDRQLSHSNLLYHQDILRQQARLLRDIIRHINRQDSVASITTSARSSQNTLRKSTAENTQKSLLADFDELLERTELLSRRCASGMDTIMNQAAIAESKRSISQAKKIEQLTLLAFFFIPLSFTTSFFGMNLGTVGTGELSLWLWFAISIPTVVLSYCLLQFLGYWHSRQ